MTLVIDSGSGGGAAGSTGASSLNVTCDSRGDDRVFVVMAVSRAGGGGANAVVTSNSGDGVVYEQRWATSHTRDGRTTRIEVFWGYQYGEPFVHHEAKVDWGATTDVCGAFIVSVGGCYDLTQPWDVLARANNAGAGPEFPYVTFDIAAENSVVFFFQAADEDSVSQGASAGWTQLAELAYRDSDSRQNRSSLQIKNDYPGPNTGITQQGAESHTNWCAMVLALTDQENIEPPETVPVAAAPALGFNQGATLTHETPHVDIVGDFNVGFNQFSPITHIDPDGPGGEELPVFQSMVVTVAN